MRSIVKVLILVTVGGFVADACSSSDRMTGNTGTGGSATGGLATGGNASGGAGAGGAGGGVGGIGGTGCQRQEYVAPGCGANAVPVCTSGTGGACAGPDVCTCDGRVIGGCNTYAAPFAYFFSGNFPLDGGNTCDPTADAGQ